TNMWCCIGSGDFENLNVPWPLYLGAIGATRQRPYMTKIESRQTTNGNTAIAIAPPFIVMTVAPSVMMARPAAASGVSPGLIRSRAGRIRPSGPGKRGMDQRSAESTKSDGLCVNASRTFETGTYVMARFQRYESMCAPDPGRWPGLLHLAPSAL